MAETLIYYTGDGSTTEYTIPFDYLKKTFVRVYLDDVLQTGGSQSDTTATYYFSSSTVIKFKTAPSSGTLILIRRYTSETDRVTTFNDGSVLKAKDLNASQIQTLHIAAEAREASLVVDSAGNYSAGKKRITNVADPVDDDDATNKAYVDKIENDANVWASIARASAGTAVTAATKTEELHDNTVTLEANARTSKNAASTSETNAKSSETNAKSSETNASNSEKLAKDWATKTEGTVDGTEYSAKYYAQQAKSTVEKGQTQADWEQTDTTKPDYINNKPSVYTKTEVDTALGKKADSSTTYTKTEVDTALGKKADSSTTYTKTEVDTLEIKLLASLFGINYWRAHETEYTVNKSSIVVPSGIVVTVGDTTFRTTSATTVSLSSATAGADYYLYAVVSSGSLSFVISANSTVPSGYTADTSRKIGGFHTLCVAENRTGKVTSGYSAGNIIPNSFWDLLHRPQSDSEGMTYVSGVNQWWDIYGDSWDGSKLVSVYKGIWADGTSTKKWHGELFAEELRKINKRLPWRDDFIEAMDGVDQAVNIYGSADPNTTGGHTNTSSNRILSKYFLEDGVGVLWQWFQDLGFAGGSEWVNTAVYNSSVDSTLKGKSYGNLYRLLGGAYWAIGGSCGSRAVRCNAVSADVTGNLGCRAVSEPRYLGY